MKPDKAPTIELTRRRCPRPLSCMRAYQSSTCPWCTAPFEVRLWGRMVGVPWLVRCHECRRVMVIAGPVPMVEPEQVDDSEEIANAPGPRGDLSRAVNRRRYCPPPVFKKGGRNRHIRPAATASC